MRAIGKRRVTQVWLGLMALTVVTTWVLAKYPGSPARTVFSTFVIAGLKVRYVMLDFMELRFAPPAAKVFFQGWIVVVLGIILGFWFVSS